MNTTLFPARVWRVCLWFAEHEAEADSQQHYSGAQVQCLDRRLNPGITCKDTQQLQLFKNKTKLFDSSLSHTFYYIDGFLIPVWENCFL